jgi:hypothetical protein
LSVRWQSCWQGMSDGATGLAGRPPYIDCETIDSLSPSFVSFLIHPLGPLSLPPAFSLPSRSLPLNMSVSTLPSSFIRDAVIGVVEDLAIIFPMPRCLTLGSNMQPLARRAKSADPFFLFPHHRPTRPVRDSSSKNPFSKTYISYLLSWLQQVRLRLDRRDRGSAKLVLGE